MLEHMILQKRIRKHFVSLCTETEQSLKTVFCGFCLCLETGPCSVAQADLELDQVALTSHRLTFLSLQSSQM